ncbi:LysR family transcriptional regulator [Paraburkholderia sp. BR14261]
MDTGFLSNLLLVVESGSMAEAARRVGVTPAAIAQQIQALERELGVALVMRAGRTVIPTEAGQRVVERARSLVRGFDELKALAQEQDLGGELRGGSSMELFEALQRGEVDVAICLHPAFALPKTYDWHLLREEPIVVLAPAKFARADPHDLLRREPFIRYDRALGGGKQADQYLRRAKIAPRELFELNSLMAIALMVDRGLGVSLVPDIGTPLTKGLRLARLPLAEATEPRRFGILWSRASARSRLIRGMIECSGEALRR